MLLVVFGLVSLGLMASSFVEIQLLERMAAGDVVREAEVVSNDSRETNLVFLWVVAFAASAFTRPRSSHGFPGAVPGIP